MKYREKNLLSSYRRKEALAGHLFALPAFFLLAVFVLYPVVLNVKWSFDKWNGIRLFPAEFVGLKNYLSLLKTPAFKQAFINTVKFTLYATAFTVILGLLLALPIDRKIRFWNGFKFINYISPMLPTLVVGALFLRILEFNNGALNSILRTLNMDGLAKQWLTDPKLAFYSIVMASTWQYSGYTMLLFISAMTGVSPDAHEAATIDGVTEVQRALYITLPIIKRQILVVIMTQLIFSFRAYEMTKVLTNAGPGTATNMLSTLLVKTGFEAMDYGMASTYSVVMIVVVSIVSIFYLRASGLNEQIREQV